MKILCLFAIGLQAQSVDIEANNRPLLEVLNELSSLNNFQFSVTDEVVENCLVNASNSFETLEQALDFILKDCELNWRKINDVFLIVQPKYYLISGQILDLKNKETLPFASIILNGKIQSTDVNGNFTFRSKTKEIQLQVSHLGYYSKDTNFIASQNLKLHLNPEVMGLEEIVVLGKQALPSFLISPRPDILKVNHKIATFLPGNADNSIFNLLRLQAGILAAGEQSRDFIVWGSYKGQTQIQFDGMTIFNPGSLNEQIGVVNPLLVKDVEVYKGGYNVDVGDRVGGLVKITSKDGTPMEFHGNLHLNTQTANVHLNLPIQDNWGLQLAARRTYYQLLPIEKILNTDLGFSDSNFGDLNVKLVGRTKSGDQLSWSSFVSNDQSSKNLDDTKETKINYFVDNAEQLRQYGSCVNYMKKWRKGSISNISLSYSGLNANNNQNSKITDEQLAIIVEEIDINTENNITELAIKWEHRLPSFGRHDIQLGAAVIRNTASFFQDSTKQNLSKKLNALNRLHAYTKDKIQITKQLYVEPGVKFDWPLNGLKLAIQPRIAAHFLPNQHWSIHLAAGRYHQYIAENSLVDGFGNYLFVWAISDPKSKRILGEHYIGGAVYQRNQFSIRTAIYRKNTSGLSRFLLDNEKGITQSFGVSRTTGFDLQSAWQIRNHRFSLAYTLSETMELFDYFNSKIWRPAPHDQRHEFKATAMLNFSPIFISTNFVYGSGIPYTKEGVVYTQVPSYQRLDASVLYKFKTNEKWRLETGLSVLNVLNRKNIRYNDFSNFPDQRTEFFQATPFSPSVFLNLHF